MSTEEPKSYQPPKQCLQDRVILITGAGSGIGRTAALSCAAQGATVILLGRTVEKLEAVYDEIEQAGSPTPAIYPLCLEGASEQDYQTLATTVEQEFGPLHGLLHNAGLLGQRTTIANYQAQIWQQVMQVNLNAQFLLTKSLLPVMKTADDAAILFTSSGVGRQGRPFWGAYAVSKFATEGLAQVLAGELDEVSNIRVNCLNPGATRTPMRAVAYPAEDPGTLFSPEQIMPAYLYLLGPDSKGISGQSFDAQ
ncbi:YciK family oxidoreductase [Gammaproteobacteria bacterium 54_18_T64]|nr:YciK family oxidoreductase [Gammaproteobacteria bacterium 54_18_T64]